MSPTLPPQAPDGIRPYQPIEHYALIGNCHGAALVARDGAIDWCCLERFDAPPAFSRLLDRRRGGFFELCPEEEFEVSRSYLPQTNILETTFATASGMARLIDLMLPPQEEGEGAPGPELVRILSGVSGRLRFRLCFRPLPGFATAFPPLRVEGHRAMAEGCPSLLSDEPLVLEDEGAVARFTLSGGGHAAFRLFRAGAATVEDRVDVYDRLERARQGWISWSGTRSYHGPLQDDLVRSALVLKALTYEPSGALVAAPTTSLPEEIGGIRNWDYRFCWLRDSCLAFYALKKFGHVEESERFFGFVRKLSMRDDGGLRPLYAIDGRGEGLEEHEIAHFEGWCGSAPVRAGNGAADQHQADVYGQLLDLVHLRTRLGGELDEEACGQIVRVADYVARVWREPDNGLWEPRLPPTRYLHAVLMNWVALDRAIHLLGEREEWRAARDAIVAEVNDPGVHPHGGYLTQSFGGDAVDASVLLAPMLGFPVDEAVFNRTVDEIIRQLGHGALVYRYRTEDGLPGHEGTFLLCAFWLVDALAWLGREEEARQRFDALRALANDVGLFPEEIAEDGTFLGNFPQAFSHLGFLHSAMVLDLLRHGGRDAVRGTYADRTLRETPSRRVVRLR
ncbi:glycoside hydrolase family 15 protein [Roseomonas gilardii]|uniref:glycoside hydrolase family 15 protein n=1 Tax=Roseomonas gilardii TaxID=257708 RepID=UPI0004838D2E|nr:glycoside hydrolase family 15 protein [Roseomonas gilardii]SUE63133.1 Trehalase [Roseomonas gilardii subsp. rosea]